MQPSVVPVLLKAYIIANESDLNKTFVKLPYSHNITRAEKAAIKSLSSNSGIVIKKADKSGTVVVQNLEDYIAGGVRQLSDSVFYKEVPDDLTEEHNSQVSKPIDALIQSGQLNKNLECKLKTNSPEPHNFTCYPKSIKTKKTTARQTYCVGKWLSN